MISRGGTMLMCKIVIRQKSGLLTGWSMIDWLSLPCLTDFTWSSARLWMQIGVVSSSSYRTFSSKSILTWSSSIFSLCILSRFFLLHYNCYMSHTGSLTHFALHHNEHLWLIWDLAIAITYKDGAHLRWLDAIFQNQKSSLSFQMETWMYGESNVAWWRGAMCNMYGAMEVEEG